MACRITKTGIKPCKGLEQVWETGGSGSRHQGVKLQTLINTTTGKFSRHLVIIKSGKHGKLGIIANNCPFCGETLYEDKSSKRRRAA